MNMLNLICLLDIQMAMVSVILDAGKDEAGSLSLVHIYRCLIFKAMRRKRNNLEKRKEFEKYAKE